MFADAKNVQTNLFSLNNPVTRLRKASEELLATPAALFVNAVAKLSIPTCIGLICLFMFVFNMA